MERKERGVGTERLEPVVGVDVDDRKKKQKR